MRHRQQDSISESLLLALLAVACVAGASPLAEGLARALAPSIVAARECRTCGVVEEVREVTLNHAKHGVSTVTGEAFAMLLSLRGKLGAAPAHVYEVEVLLQDGSVRVIREGSLPAWKQ